MGTRSTISVQDSNGRFHTVYCHWDGYLEHNGRILNRSYTTVEQALKLVSGGDMSSLDDDISKVVYYAGEDEYKRVQIMRSMAGYESSLGAGEYDYLMKSDGVWMVSTGDSRGFVPLADELYELAANSAE